MSNLVGVYLAVLFGSVIGFSRIFLSAFFGKNRKTFNVLLTIPFFAAFILLLTPTGMSLIFPNPDGDSLEIVTLIGLVICIIWLNQFKEYILPKISYLVTLGTTALLLIHLIRLRPIFDVLYISFYVLIAIVSLVILMRKRVLELYVYYMVLTAAFTIFIGFPVYLLIEGVLSGSAELTPQNMVTIITGSIVFPSVMMVLTYVFMLLPNKRESSHEFRQRMNIELGDIRKKFFSLHSITQPEIVILILIISSDILFHFLLWSEPTFTTSLHLIFLSVLARESMRRMGESIRVILTVGLVRYQPTGEYLVLQVSPQNDRWEFVTATHRNNSEDPIRTCNEELRRETGLASKDIWFGGQFEILAIENIGDARMVGNIYLLFVDHKDVQLSSDHTAFKWVMTDELDTVLLTQSSRQALKYVQIDQPTNAM